MATNVLFNGTTYSIPAEGDSNWGTNLSNYFIAIASGCLQKTGGTFTLTAEANFGATYGLKSAYFKSQATNPASAGILRLGNAESIKWRNAANSADLDLTVSAGNALQFNGTSLTLSGSIVNADVNAAAAIALSKLAALTVSRALVSDGSGVISVSAATSTEVGYLSGVTSAIQTQLNGKQATGSYALTTGKLSQFAATTSAELAGVISDETGSGALVFATSPTLTTPNIGVATATSVNGTTIPNTKTLVVTTDKLSALAATTSAELAGVISDETGSGALVFANTPTLVTPVLGAATGTSLALGSTLNASSIVDLTSTTKGFLPPRMTSTQRDAIGTPATGLQIFNTDSGKNNVYNGTSWVEVGSGSSGVNYCANGTAENNTTTGWTTFADGASYVDGTGGSPTATWTVSSSSPLRGAKSFLFTAGTAGDGVSFDFTIDSADKGKTITAQFDYEIVTFASFTDNDYEFWIYDVTNAVAIQPVGYQLKNSSLPNKHVLQFQTASSSTSYRFSIFQKDGTTSNVRFENIEIGPKDIARGSVITDWVSFTPTVTVSSGSMTNVTQTGRYRRVGDQCFVDGSMSFSAASAAFGTVRISIPSGLSFDTTKLSNSTSDGVTIGHVSVLDAGSNVYSGGIITYNTGTAGTVKLLAMSVQTHAGTAPLAGANYSDTFPFTLGSGDIIHYSYSFPVSGWSSNTLMSSDSGGRLIAARYATSAGQSIANNSTTIIDFGTKTFDTVGAVTTGASWKFTAPESGYYQVSSKVVFASSTTWADTEEVDLFLFKNNSQYSTIDRKDSFGSASAVFACVTGTDIISLVAGDFIDIRILQTSGGTINLLNDSAHVFAMVNKISTPQTVAGTETVAVNAYNAAGTTISTDAAIPFATEVFDTHGAWATDTFTAPMSGKYLVNFAFYTNGVALTVGNNLTATIVVNGSGDGLFLKEGSGTSNNQAVSGSKVVSLNSGGTIKINASLSTGSVALNSGTGRNFVCITRVGN